MGRRVKTLVVVVTLGLVGLMRPAPAATPEAGAIDGSHAEVRWSGAPLLQTAGLQGGGCVMDAPDPTCDTFALAIGELSQPLDDVQVAIATPTAGLAEFDLYVYAPDGTEVARKTDIGSNDTIVVQSPAVGTYTVAVQKVLATDPEAAYDAVARRVDGSGDQPIDDPTPCGFESSPELRELDAAIGQGLGSVVGDPTAALDGQDTAEPVSLDVLVILDGVAQSDAEKLFATAARSYAPLNIQLRAARFLTHSFATNEAPAIIREAKALVGGSRPADIDIVEVLTSQDIQALGQAAVAGLADCIGGVAHDDRAFLVAEATTPSDVAIGPLVFGYEANPNVTAHEIGHLMGGQHHYANCVEGIQRSDVHEDEGFVEGSPCTVMFNAADFLGPNFDTVNGAIVRGHALRHARP